MNFLKIDLGAIAHNLNQIKKILPKDTKIMGIVKSDAYGHGLLPVSRLLINKGIDMLGVSYLFEAYELIRNGINANIVTLCGIFNQEEAVLIVEKNIIPVIWDIEMVHILDKEAERKGKKAEIFIKLDTGMGRLGIKKEDLPQFIRRLSSFKSVKTKGLLSHLSSADSNDEESKRFTKKQIKIFKESIGICRQMGIDLSMNSIANSAGILKYNPESIFELVRPGIILYGAYPSPEFKTDLNLRHAMKFSGRILQIRDIPAGMPISYGRTYYTKEKKIIAIISAGYGNGIPRAISNKGYVLIRGEKAPIIGKVCMDLMVCDITGIKDVREGDEVVFMGRSGDEVISSSDIAKWANTIPYEILCSIGKINKREYER